MQRFRFILLVFLALPLTGCLFHRHGYNGPVLNTANLKEATRDQLIEAINAGAAKIQTIDATVDIAASVGGQKKGTVTDYTDIKGYLLVREPDMLRMIGLFPLVRNKAFDMVSDGGRFKLSIPTKNKFYVGSNEIVHPSTNALENLRPQVIFSALLLHSIDPREDPAFLEVGMEEVQQPNSKKIVEQPDYEIIVGAHDAKGWFLSRKIIFSRTDLQPHRQLIYDRFGNVATDARYDAFQTYDGVNFPSQIEISRPQEEYTITLKMEKVKINEPLRPEQFVLNQPPGSQLVQMSPAPPAASNNTGAPQIKP
jgi:outer membrane lipoprotein-sorting protein